MKIHLNQTFNYIQVFTDLRTFAACLDGTFIVQKIVCIVSGKLAKFLCDVARMCPQCQYVYELQLEDEPLSLANSHASHVFDSVDGLFAHMKCLLVDEEKEKKVDEESLSLSIFSSSWTDESFLNLSKGSLKFLLFQVCIEVLHSTQSDPNSMADMLGYCRRQYEHNTDELYKIDDFHTTYRSDKAIFHYTKDSFVFREVNRAFRSEDIERMFTFRRYITDLHRQLVQKTNRQESIPSQNTMRLYRGNKLSTYVLQQLNDNVGCLISINSFLLTTEDRDVAKRFARVDHSINGYESVLLELCIDNTMSSKRPYANIRQISRTEDGHEILFSIGSVWRIQSMENSDDSVWTIQLRSCCDLDSQLAEIYEKFTDGCTFFSMGNILRELGEYENAKAFYYRMLEHRDLPDETRAQVYYSIRTLANEQDKYSAALEKFGQAANLLQSSATPYDKRLASIPPLRAHNILSSQLRVLNSMGLLYHKIGDYERAHKSFTKALDEQGCAIDIAIVHNNLGLLELYHGHYEPARKQLNQAVELAKDHERVREFKQNLDAVNHRLFR
ncbi:unnamed protein product [Didymodactylos carnosus]|uniref:Uncharacterized protein n=1 Tax=Didymodactylos carnosus TaxID=1234261 RepID=A0A8S2P4C7_9BILA|nr:unnamed protein product [Didymodactylos carnosus]CAF4033613.1 unnamed protein product [Didymodactylos carnosus]